MPDSTTSALDSTVPNPDTDSSASTQPGAAGGSDDGSSGLTGDAKRLADTQAALTGVQMEKAELRGRLAAMEEQLRGQGVQPEPDEPDPLQDSEWTDEKIAEMEMTRKQADFYRDKLIRNNQRMAKTFEARDRQLKQEFAQLLSENLDPDRSSVQEELDELKKLPGFNKLTLKEQIAQAKFYKQQRGGVTLNPPGAGPSRSAGSTGQRDVAGDERKARIEAIKKAKFQPTYLTNKII